MEWKSGPRLCRVSGHRAEPILLPSGATWLAIASWEAKGVEPGCEEVLRLCQI